MRSILTLTLFLLLSIAYKSNSFALNSQDNQTPGSPAVEKEAASMLSFTSGTGFFVDYHHIITNEHVVNNCTSIQVRGAINPTYAALLAVDPKSDLALLQSMSGPIHPAALRGTNQIRVGENVSVMGYPLKSGITGKHVVKNAVITDISDGIDNFKNIQFTDSVEKGNSGGPLLDKSGTVIGVVVGKMKFYLTSKYKSPNPEPIKISSVAVNLQTLKDFLKKLNISYYTNDVNTPYSSSYMEKKAKQYIVNIHCIKNQSTASNNTTKYNYKPLSQTYSIAK